MNIAYFVFTVLMVLPILVVAFVWKEYIAGESESERNILCPIFITLTLVLYVILLQIESKCNVPYKPIFFSYDHIIVRILTGIWKHAWQVIIWFAVLGLQVIIVKNYED